MHSYLVKKVIQLQLNLMQNLKFICLLLAIYIWLVRPTEIFIDFSEGNDSLLLYKYLHGVKNKYFVDIGAYDPIRASNTKMFTDWHGIYVEASQERAKNFVFSSRETILNLAVSTKSGQIVELLDFGKSWDSGSTISLQARQNFNQTKNRPILLRQKVVTITMADLCHKYYMQKPVLLSLDIEGFGYAALESNDWKTNLCIPDIILAQDSDYNKASGLPSIEQFLKQQNYTLMKTNGLDKLFIHNFMRQYYIYRSQLGEEKLKKMQIVKWKVFVEQFIKKIVPHSAKNRDYQHVHLHLTPLYIHFCRQSIISLPDINQRSNFISRYKNRPILLLHFNPHRMKLFLGTNKYENSFEGVGMFNYAKINIYIENFVLIVYVLNHQIQPQVTPKIIEFKESEKDEYKNIEVKYIQNSQTQRQQFYEEDFLDEIQTKLQDNKLFSIDPFKILTLLFVISLALLAYLCSMVRKLKLQLKNQRKSNNFKKQTQEQLSICS